ncbi:bifunctional diguanylate cyclase/phosphodiesterase [Agaribacter flavus]|uniref:Diguanylate cyclase domain-containing protein n=1 Tax=Agaribacter flavus TaxID=1902781 RepID=A0ABV7FV17_9ALTE
MAEQEVIGELSESELRALVPQLQQLTERYKRAENIQKALFAISELSSSVLSLESLYEEIHKIVQNFMEADNFFVAFNDQDHEQITFAYFVDEYDEEVVSSLSYDQIKNGVTAYILKSNEPLILTQENYLDICRQKGFEILGSPPVDLIGVPITKGDKVIGAMVVQSYNQSVRYNQDDHEILVFISQHIVTTVDRVKNREIIEDTIHKRTRELQRTNARLTEEISERKRVESLQQALFEISEQSSSSDEDIVVFYQKIHNILMRLLVAPNCYIAELDEKNEILTFPYFVGSNNDNNVPRQLKLGLTEYVIKKKTTVLLNPSKIAVLKDKQEVDAFTADKMIETGNSWLGAPLLINGKVQGVIAVQTYGSGAEYNEGDQNILRFVSQHIAVAIERRQASQNLLRYNQQLSDMVKERTAELNHSNQSLKKQIEQRKEVELKLIYEAHHDSLTGLPNRVMFNSRVDLAIASKSRHTDYNFALLFIDLDRFKNINDTLGHHAGDEFLIEVAKRITECKRSHDLLARLGGDEFVVLLDSFLSLKDVEQIAQRIVDSISAPFFIEGKEVYSGASIGIAEISLEYETADQVLRDADAAMYQAKSLGRNRFVFFDISMRNQLIKEVDLENNFRKAFSQHDFSYFIQAIVSAVDDDILYHEFTIAWHYEPGKLLMRSEFWELANKTGLTHSINRFLIEMAFVQLKKWKKNKATAENKLGLTLSVEHLLHKASYEALIQQLEWSEIDSSLLVIELSESAITKFPKYLPSVLNKLHALGVTLVLDNFGNESGSLTHLLKYDFDFIKLNAALVNTFSMSYKYHKLVESIILVANNMGIQVIADGVLDEATQQELLLVDCHYLQGPVASPAEQIEL